MNAGSSSLLRLSSAPLVRVAVLGLLAVAVAPPLATAASPAPDPSPRTGLVVPDPYPAPHAPTRPAEPVHITTVPVYVQRIPARVQTPAASVAPKHAVRHRAQKHATRQKVQKAQKVPVRSTQPVEPIRIPDHAAPHLTALAQVTGSASKHVPRTLVLTLGLLVLLSASLVAGAARELAR